MAPPLTDVRVLDLSTGPVGGVATMVLADFGAEVVKVEPVGGEPWRSLAAAPMWLRGKRSVELDVDSDRSRLEELVHEADVVVSTDSPAQSRARRLEYADIRALNDAVVFCSITGFGPTGAVCRVSCLRGAGLGQVGADDVVLGSAAA